MTTLPNAFSGRDHDANPPAPPTADAIDEADLVHYIFIGDQKLPLPAGVDAARWGLERVRVQNPRIRAFLGCIRLLGDVMESNYAILHCSPERLIEIWRKVRKVTSLIREDIAPLLERPSCIPRLEEARASADTSLVMLSRTVLSQVERLPRELPADRLLEVRKLLCVSIGQLHAFLQDTFSQLMASDPRSQHDADYFLSKRFPQDIEEAEWLHATVGRLHRYLYDDMTPRRDEQLRPLIESLALRRRLPEGTAWVHGEIFLNHLLSELTPKLKEILALRGIRFHEMEILDRYACDLPVRCEQVLHLYRLFGDLQVRFGEVQGIEQAQRLQSEQDLGACHIAFSHYMEQHLLEVDRMLNDLMAFVPIWLRGIEKRRALLLHRSGRDQDSRTRVDGEVGLDDLFA
ncbi:MAG: hypothetical protein AAF772_04050 [Acidobacteriota bacterium]